jgi:hypothetical protein
MAEATYQVRVRNTSGAQIAVFSGAGRGAAGGGLVSLSYTRRVRTAGQWTVRIDGNDERIALLEMQDVGDRRVDYLFEFWRRDPLGGLDWYRDFCGFHRWDGWDQDAEGREMYIASGRGLNDLCAAECIAWPAGSAGACKNAAAETAAKEYVDENVGPGATVVAGRRRAGSFQGLTVEANAATGAAWEGCRSNKNLIDILAELAEYAPGDFMVVPTSYANDPITMEFRWKAGQWGLDCTEGNGVNVPAIFDPLLGNMENAQYVYSRLDEVNVCDVGGPGEGAARSYTTRTTGAEGDSPWARRAVFRDARNAASATEEADKAWETLNKQEAKRTFTFDARQTPATRYGRDWNLGYLVTVNWRTFSAAQKIRGVQVTMNQAGNETIRPEMEDA